MESKAPAGLNTFLGITFFALCSVYVFCSYTLMRRLYYEYETKIYDNQADFTTSFSETNEAAFAYVTDKQGETHDGEIAKSQNKSVEASPNGSENEANQTVGKENSMEFNQDPSNQIFYPLFDLYVTHTLYSNVCDTDESIFLLSLVHSKVDHFRQRQAIRRTWGARNVLQNLNTRIVFVLAQVNSKYSNSMLIQRLVAEESRIYGDIIQGSFIDDFHNMTYKFLFGMYFVAKNCIGVAKFVLKTDDDIAVDIVYLTELLGNKPDRRLIYCGVWHSMEVIRYRPFSGLNRYALSKEEFPANTFEPYCTGWGYVLTPDVANALISVSLGVKYIHIDDAMEGILASRANLQHTEMHFSLYDFRLYMGEELLEDYIPKRRVVFRSLQPEDIEFAWNRQMSQYGHEPNFRYNKYLKAGKDLTW